MSVLPAPVRRWLFRVVIGTPTRRLASAAAWAAVLLGQAPRRPLRVFSPPRPPANQGAEKRVLEEVLVGRVDARLLPAIGAEVFRPLGATLGFAEYLFPGETLQLFIATRHRGSVRAAV